jgi:alpha-amylase/alpha-mannosidase (GH57 family)
VSGPLRAICLYGHFYQPPREHPWLGTTEPDPTAAPDRDWNTRITRECYAPNAAARILDASGRLRDLVNVYEWATFDFGPTLLSWLEAYAPQVLTALRRGDAASTIRTGCGNAWAQPYVHAILPLSTPRDSLTQVLWGKRDFERRFGRAPDGMWLPEMAVDAASLAAVAQAGVSLTMLAPHQARRVRPLGAGDDAWVAVTPATLDTRRLYRCLLPDGLSVDVLFRDAGLSDGVGFGRLLKDGVGLAARLREAALEGEGPSIVSIAVDGETFGHHHRFAEMAVASALRTLRDDPDVGVMNPAAFRAAHPATHEVEIADATSWSCPHGVERWRAECGCTEGSLTGGSQAWRGPLRKAIDWLRDETAAVYLTRAAEVFGDPWGARDRYIDCILDPSHMAAFLAAEAPKRLSPSETIHAKRALELARHALFMQTSCGWFFDELTRVEPLIILGHAARVIELASGLGRRLEEGFLSRLEEARSNVREEGTGADVYRRRVRPAAATAARVAATGAMLALAKQPPRVPGYELAFSEGPEGDRLMGDARVTELATGLSVTLPVLAERPPGGAPRARVWETEYTMADLFGVQRERLLDAVARDAGASARTGRRSALTPVRPMLDPLLAGETPLPFELAVLLGYEEAEAMAGALDARAAPLRALIAHATALRKRGMVLPTRWLAGRLGRALEERLGTLPGSAEDAVAVLDLAEAAGATLDLSSAQIRALTWWKDAPAATRTDPSLAALWTRLHVAPEA